MTCDSVTLCLLYLIFYKIRKNKRKKRKENKIGAKFIVPNSDSRVVSINLNLLCIDSRRDIRVY